MYRSIILLAMVLFSGACLAQGLVFADLSSRPSSPVFLKDTPHDVGPVSAPRGLRMRNTGRVLTICGGALAIGGIVMMNSADELYYTSTTSSQSGTVEEGDPKGALGVLMTVSGVGMMVPGIIFWSKGQKKYNRYLEQQSVSLKAGASGVSVRYSF
jgi:hypothetical protein